MNVYRLEPIDAASPLWKYSEEKYTVWTCAATPKDARDQVTARTGFKAASEPGAVSPWQDDKVTSCVADPTMTYPDPGEVIREDGSEVDF
jgi:hypothetical protein